MVERIFATSRGDIHYWTSAPQAGDRAALVFLPGLTADHRLFDRQIAYFGAEHPLLVWDAPGHGATRPFRLDFTLMDKARWLHAILEREGMARPVLVGQSMGGYVAQAYLQRFPGAARGFVAIDSAPLQRRYVTAAELWMLRRMEPVYRRMPWDWLRRSAARGCAVSPYGRALMGEMLRAYDGDQAGYAALAGHGYQMLAVAMEADLPYAIDCPALLICGQQDRAASTRRYNRAWSCTAGLPVFWVPDAGHNSNTDQPALVNAAIRRFLRRSCP
ncbi:MAG: alpha/beta hydrolase [Oscillospiraceae bacterium]|nr:alpha/beta hydrolase [Oscillospiraceae bacterium]